MRSCESSPLICRCNQVYTDFEILGIPKVTALCIKYNVTVLQAWIMVMTGQDSWWYKALFIRSNLICWSIWKVHCIDKMCTPEACNGSGGQSTGSTQ